MNINKNDLINKIKENNGAPSIQDIGTAADNVNKMTQSVQKLGGVMDNLKQMGFVQEEIDEMFDPAKNFQSSIDFFRDMIDKLLNRNFGITYYQPNGEDKPISQMSPEEYKKLADNVLRAHGTNGFNYVINQIRKAEEVLKDGNSEHETKNPLRNAYIALQNIKRVNEEGGGKIFHMIAEAEPQRITKEKILEFLKRK